tara:strand:+ start:295 stop:552 length:258 start_codon:yes stop_codon:yes gene_type:complete
MLTLEQLVSKLRKELRDNYQSIGDAMIAGGCTNMEQYKYMLGQAHAYQSLDSALTDILNRNDIEEEKDDERQNNNVIQFGRNSED